MKVNRSYKLKLYGSEAKFNDLAWSSYQYTKMVNAFTNHLYFNNVKYYSTQGMGVLGNQAQQKALGIVKSKKSNEENGHKKSIPELKKPMCFVNIKKQSSHHHFNYRINFGVSLGEDRSKPRYLFAKGIKPLKKALKEGWKLSNQSEAYLEKDGHWYVRVFVSKEVKKVKAKNKSMGIDVGVNQIITTSEGYLGNSLSKRLKKLNKSKKEKARQLSLTKNRKDKNLIENLQNNLTKNKKISKTIIKMLLDKEAKRIIARGLGSLQNLIVEDPKVLANLRSKGLVRWAKTYFAHRLEVLGKEKGVFVVFTNPAYTSVTCSKCLTKDKGNRDRIKFHCNQCGHKDHADINAAVNLSRKGQEFVDRYILKNITFRSKNPE